VHLVFVPLYSCSMSVVYQNCAGIDIYDVNNVRFARLYKSTLSLTNIIVRITPLSILKQEKYSNTLLYQLLDDCSEQQNNNLAA
jgi:hypothetical protein